jgi:hypothetical protein
LFSNSENVEVQLGTTQTWWTFSLSHLHLELDTP